MALPYLAVAFEHAPYTRAWQYDEITGACGAAIDPPVNVGSIARAIAFHPTANYVAVAHDAAPFVTIYNFNKATGVWGAKIADPATPIDTTQAFWVAWHPSGDYVAIAHRTNGGGTGPVFSVYAFDKVAGAWGARSANPGAVFVLSQSVDWHPTGKWLLVGHTGSPNATIYPFAAATGVISAKLANPATLPGATVKSARFARNGNWIAITWSATSPKLGAWVFNQGGAGTWGAKSTAPAAVGTDDSHNAAIFNTAITRVLSCQNINNGGPHAYAYDFNSAVSGAFGARRAAALPALTDNNNDMALNPSELLVAVGALSGLVAGNPALGIWRYDGSDYGVRLADPPSVPAAVGGVAAQVFGIGWSEAVPLDVTAVTPATGVAGTSVTISGTGFATGATVTFGGVPATGVSVVSSTQITVTTPAGTGTVAVTVTNPNAQSDSLANAFTYASPHPTPLGGGPQPLQSSEREALRVLGTAQRLESGGHGSQSFELTLLQLLDVIHGTQTPHPMPLSADFLFDEIFRALAIQRPRYATTNALLALIEANLS